MKWNSSSSSKHSARTDAPDIRDAVSRSALRWLVLAAVLLLLNQALTYHNRWPTFWITTHWELSPELAVMLTTVGMLGLRGLAAARASRWLAVILMVLVLGRYAEVTAPALYGRAINLYWDARHFPAVAAMFARALPGWQLLLLVTGLATALWLLWRLMHLCSRVLLAAGGDPVMRRATLGVGLLALVLYGAGLLSARLHTERWFAWPVSRMFALQGAALANSLAGADDSRPDPFATPLAVDPRLLEGADLRLLFVESYGMGALDNPLHAKRVRPALKTLQLARPGPMLSARITAPTFAGASWLSHASLLSGVRVADQGDYQRLLTSRRQTLVGLFRQQGYRTVALFPGLRKAWPEGSFYGFDRILTSAELAYPGPDFGWWRIPDQYSLARLGRLESPSPDQPVLLVSANVSSHAPFQPVPPFLEPWQRALADQAYGSTSDTLPDSPPRDLGQAYGESLAYALASLAGFLANLPDRAGVSVVLGDHQPASRISGPGANWDVPVHVMGAGPRMRERLLAAGFRSGTEPGPRSLGEMHQLAGLLLEPTLRRAAQSGSTSHPGVPTL